MLWNCQCKIIFTHLSLFMSVLNNITLLLNTHFHSTLMSALVSYIYLFLVISFSLVSSLHCCVHSIIDTLVCKYVLLLCPMGGLQWNKMFQISNSNRLKVLAIKNRLLINLLFLPSESLKPSKEISLLYSNDSGGFGLNIYKMYFLTRFLKSETQCT